MKQKKLILIIALFAFSTILSALPTPVAATGSWVDMDMTRNLYHGSYNSGTQVATEGLFLSNYIFSCHWSTVDAIPDGRDISEVRVKFYFKAYFWWWIYYYNEPISVHPQNYDYSYDYGTYTYSPSSYLSGGYIYINLGPEAEGHRIRLIFRDTVDPDNSISKWYIGEPVVQYWSGP